MIKRDGRNEGPGVNTLFNLLSQPYLSKFLVNDPYRTHGPRHDLRHLLFSLERVEDGNLKCPKCVKGRKEGRCHKSLKRSNCQTCLKPGSTIETNILFLLIETSLQTLVDQE